MILASRNKQKLWEVQTELKRAIYQAKLKYKEKMENMFRTKWYQASLVISTNNCSNKLKKARTSFEPENKSEFFNEFNSFYARYDNQDFRKRTKWFNCYPPCQQDPEITFNEEDVDKALIKIKARKTCGPDNICGILPKTTNANFNSHISTVCT